MKKLPRQIIIILTLLSFLSLQGCAWWKKDESLIKSDGYRRMLELQKTRDAAASEEIRAADKMGEPDAAELERLGDQYLRQGNSNMSFIYYDKSLRMDPKRTDVRYKKAMLLVSRGLLAEASAEFDEILKNDRSYAAAYEGRGRIALLKGNQDEAETQFREAVKLNEELWQSHSFLGIIADRRRQYGEAAVSYQKAIRVNPKSADLFNNLGFSYALQGEYEKALEAYVIAAGLSQNNTRVYGNMGIVLGRLHRYDEAMDAFRKAGDEASAYNNLGCVYMVEGEYAKAVEVFRKAMELNPKFFVRAHENLIRAEALMKKGELQRSN